MNILITGANGFIGKNLVATLQQTTKHNLMLVTRNTTNSELEMIASKADFVFHLAGVNRPENENEFIEGNVNFTEKLINYLIKANNIVPVLITSSTQAENNSKYGESKKNGEILVEDYGVKHNVNTYIYRLPNVFGKWSKPNYNSAVATFCHKIIRDEEITIHDPNVELTLVYIDDVIKAFLNNLENKGIKIGRFYKVSKEYKKKLSYIVELINGFKKMRISNKIVDLSDDFTQNLYSTYLNFLPEDKFGYELNSHTDERGSFTEFVKSAFSGQVSINISKPGITKGQHWHHSKNEKFLVVSGHGVVRFRDYFSKNIIEYEVSGGKLEVIDIPTGYTHSIVNTGNVDMVTVMWVNEMFDSGNPDTYFLEV